MLKFGKKSKIQIFRFQNLDQNLWFEFQAKFGFRRKFQIALFPRVLKIWTSCKYIKYCFDDVLSDGARQMYAQPPVLRKKVGFWIFWNFRENDKKAFKTWNLITVAPTSHVTPWILKFEPSASQKIVFTVILLPWKKLSGCNFLA